MTLFQGIVSAVQAAPGAAFELIPITVKVDSSVSITIETVACRKSLNIQISRVLEPIRRFQMGVVKAKT